MPTNNSNEFDSTLSLFSYSYTCQLIISPIKITYSVYETPTYKITLCSLILRNKMIIWIVSCTGRRQVATENERHGSDDFHLYLFINRLRIFMYAYAVQKEYMKYIRYNIRNNRGSNFSVMFRK